jgi:uncharacterized protein YmfQ (DUF2313 family)
MPRGKAWPRDNNGVLTQFLRALAKRLSQAEFDAERLLPEMRPESTFLLLDEWEEYLELPECEQASGTVDDRRRAVVEKYHRKGGLAPWQIEGCGRAWVHYPRECDSPHHCLRSCMSPLYPARYRWILQIDVLDISGGRFTCIDNVMTPLLSERARELECVLTKYRLAGTSYEYSYL